MIGEMFPRKEVFSGGEICLSFQRMAKLSIFTLFVFNSGPFANCLCEIYSFRSVMMAGGLMAFLGLFLSAFAPQMEFWILTYGVISGLIIL
jgi:hypothetical protein